ncbi:MAG: penicillin acylase family protein [Gemmatimonadetes bacterium]|nr:penicillin acylase family protein [Gemmatimonadota bacterium]NNM05577.1 penicillin acylase family protein [Gemmatimonadota bacterium]
MPYSNPSGRPSLPTSAVVFLLGACLTLSGGCGALDDSGRRSPEDFQELALAHLPTIDGELRLPGLGEEVEVLRDPWGVPHIYAQNLDDLFFTQGFVQAQDRLWQMEMYRRTGEGRVAEVLGPEALEHDRLARLLRYRGPWTDEEFNSYHPEGRRILAAFARGVNAYIEHAGDQLPVEFELTGILPEPWTAETPLLRMQTAMPLGDVRRELRLAGQVAELGQAEANRRARPSPYRELSIPAGVDLGLITDEVEDGVSGFRNGMPRPELLPRFQDWLLADSTENAGAREDSPGSNNWAISPRLSATGSVLVANDPHRGVTNPSLRYVVHLDAPGWTAIGSTEPVLPGVAIGHNGNVAWGLTIVGTDQSDVFVEELNPGAPNQVRWQGTWEPLTVILDTILVQGAEPQVIELKYSRHGPIFYEDTENHLAYALRSTMHEPGSTGYLAALRLNVVEDCRAFLEELRYWKAPTENMICGDSQGNISWQASAASPRREGWMGRLPVPGTGEYEWDGFRDDLPTEFNPARGWVGTANHDIHPPGYDPPLFFKTGSSFPRFERVSEVLSGAGAHSMEDSKALQQDAYLASAVEAVAIFRGWTANDPDLEETRQDLAVWDGFYRKESRAAAIWDRVRRHLPPGIQIASLPPGRRAEVLERVISQGLEDLRETQGPDPAEWRWGRIHRSEFPHSLVEAYDIPLVERSGGAGTVAATGATYRHIIDFSDLDASVFTNAPGQSGRPGSPYYGNLTEPWGAGEYFPLLFSRGAVEERAEYRLVLKPAG